jgi:hypothetical protein
MTWVVGLVAPGFAVGVADIRVSLSDVSGGVRPVPTLGVQKIHPVGDRVVVGFAGSIETGFALVEDLRRYSPNAVDAPLGELVRAWIDGGAGTIFGPGDDLIALGVPASRDWGPPGVSTGLAHSEGCKAIGRPGGVDVEDIPLFTSGDIGSGAGIEEYRAGLERATTPEEVVGLANFGMATGQLGLGGPGMVMSVVLSGILEANVEPTVSQDVIVCCVERGGVTLDNNQRLTGRSWPPVATSWEEIQQLAGEKGLAASTLFA